MKNGIFKIYCNYKPYLKVLFLSLYLLPGLAYAGESLEDQCKKLPGGGFYQHFIVLSYNVSTLGDSEPFIGIDILFDRNYRWYHVGYNNPALPAIYDMVKIGFLDGDPLNACIDDKNFILLGLEWPDKGEIKK